MPEPAPTRDAATVLPLREADGGFEIFLVKRHDRSGFMAGAYVFPGGTLDEADRDPALLSHVAGREPASCPAALGEPELAADLATALFFAAIRETFEEAGVLLATNEDVDVSAMDDARAGLQKGERTLVDLVSEFELTLRLDALVPQARWVTPVIERRRYDTRFFLARSPRGQEARHDRIETTAGAWFRPVDALAAAEKGEIKLPPPQLVSLEWLAGFEDVDAAMAGAASRPPPVVQPHPHAEDGTIVLALPGDPLHPLDEPAFEGSTRVLLKDGLWRRG